MMLDNIPKAERDEIDRTSLRLSNQPGSSGECVHFDALKGRKVGDMGFR
jgi:nuclear protein localization family protein 4